MINKTLFLLFIFISFECSTCGTAVYAQKKNTSMPQDSVVHPSQSVTHHTVKIDGKTIKYTATAGTLPIYDNQNQPIASFGYTAYTKDEVKDNTKRPILFAYNGGPGSASYFLHMGALGPRRVKLNDPKPVPPAPYKLVNNQYSPLDAADIVMIDPVGTGYSRAKGKKKNKYFWDLDHDISSISRFIKQYISTNNRWNSPKYILGESYGSTRSAGIVNYLLSRDGITLNGVVLLGTVLDLRTIAFGPDDNLPYVIYLPTYAAIAWHYHKTDKSSEKLPALMKEVRKFAIDDYGPALMRGNTLPEARRQQIINKLAEYTGLSKDYIDRAHLRVTASEFAKRVLHDQNKVVGRYDARYNNTSMNPLAKDAHSDPSSTAIGSAFKTTFLQYYHQDLGFGTHRQYMFSAGGLPHFNWTWPKSRGWPTTPNTSPKLAHAMNADHNLHVLVFSGYYDLATPFMGSEYTFHQLNVPDSLKSHIKISHVKAGHMSYLRLSALKKMHEGIDKFIEENE